MKNYLKPLEALMNSLQEPDNSIEMRESADSADEDKDTATEKDSDKFNDVQSTEIKMEGYFTIIELFIILLFFVFFVFLSARQILLIWSEAITYYTCNLVFSTGTEPAAVTVQERLMISKIVNHNFKSYAGTQVLGPFHKV